MRFLALLLLSLTLLTAGVGAKETKARPLELFVNGVKADVNPVVDLGTTYYPVEPIAKAMGAKLTASDGMLSLNGRQLDTPPLIIEGEPYLSLEVLATALSATVDTDPVRGIVNMRGAKVGEGPGLPVYTADYKTPEQEERDRKVDMWTKAGLPGQAMLEEKEKQMKAMEPKTNPAITRSKPDIPPMFPSHPWMSTDSDPGIPDGSANAPEAQPARYASAGFAHRSQDNGNYRLTVTDVKVAEALQGLNPPAYPRPGYRFVVVFVTQENLTKNKVNPAWFAVRDAAGMLYPAEEALSQFSLAQLRSREITTGYVVSQVPVSSTPVSVELITSPAVSVGFGEVSRPEGR